MRNIKEKILKLCLSNELYCNLNKVDFDEEIDRTMKILENKYVSLCKHPIAPIGCSEEEKLLLNHSKQSEVLGKLIMLVHEYNGFNGVRELIVRLENSMYGIMIDNIEAKEDEILRLKKEIEKLKENNYIIKQEYY